MSARTRCAVRLSPLSLSVQTSVVIVPWTKTRSPLLSDSAMFSPRVLNAFTTCRVGSASTHTPYPLRRRSWTSTVISVTCFARTGEPDLQVVGQVALEGDRGTRDAAPFPWL